jgi:flagellar hook-length control protein FliK
VAATLAPPPVEPQAPTTAPGKTAKAEKTKGPAAAAAAAAADAPKAAAAANKPNAVDAVDGASGKPAHAEAEAVEAKSREAKTSAPSETVDTGAPGEARAAAQAAQPATHTAHAVRGAPETVANLAAQILKKLEGKTTRFDVELDPQGLGKVDVRVEIGATGQITAAMTFDNPGAAAEVKARAAELQKALEQAGFDLSGGSLSFDVADQGQGQGWQGPAWANPDDSSGRAFRGQAFRAALDTAGEAADAAANGALRLTRRAASGLDLRI